MGKSIINWIGFAVCLQIVMSGLAPFAGLNTDMNVLLNLVAKVDVSKIKFEISFGVFGTMGIIYGGIMHKLLLRYRKKYCPIDAEIQKSINPNRQSSGLNIDGTTRSEDR